MKYYKGTYNQTCFDFRYEVGEIYEIEGPLVICENGFHFCEKADDVLSYYEPAPDFVLLEVEALGEIVSEDDKYCTDKIKILRVVPQEEWNDVFKEYVVEINGNTIHCKYSGRYEWWKEYDQNNNEIRYKNSAGFDRQFEYDQNNNEIYYKDSDGTEEWREYDQNNNVIHYKNAWGFEYWKEY